MPSGTVPPERFPTATMPPDPIPPPPPLHDDAPVASEGDHTPLLTTVPEDSEGGASVPLANASPAPRFPSRNCGGT